MRNAIETIITREVNMRRLSSMSNTELLWLILQSSGPRSHRIGCACGGVNDHTGVSCAELWGEVGRRAEAPEDGKS